MVQDDQHAAIVYRLDLRKWSPTEIHKTQKVTCIFKFKKQISFQLERNQSSALMEGTAKTKRDGSLVFSELETQDQHSDHKYAN